MVCYILCIGVKMNRFPDNVQLKDVNVFERSVSRRPYRELIFLYGIILCYLPLSFFMLFMQYYSSSDFRTLFHSELSNIFSLTYITLVAVLLVVVFFPAISLGIAIKFNRYRHCIAFKIQPPSSDESEFPLFSFDSLLRRVANPVISTGNSLLAKEQELFSSTTKDSQLGVFELKKMRRLTGSFFVISSHKSEDAANTFVFYSRHKFIWHDIQKLLKTNNFEVEVLDHKIIHV